jgi:hypothetical protein
MGGLEQLAVLVLVSREQPEPGSPKIEASALLVDAALAEVEDLLAPQQGVDHHSPLLARRQRSGHNLNDRPVA